MRKRERGGEERDHASLCNVHVYLNTYMYMNNTLSTCILNLIHTCKTQSLQIGDIHVIYQEHIQGGKNVITVKISHLLNFIHAMS